MFAKQREEMKAAGKLDGLREKCLVSRASIDDFARRCLCQAAAMSVAGHSLRAFRLESPFRNCMQRI